jgi:hypothetical protein
MVAVVQLIVMDATLNVTLTMLARASVRVVVAVARVAVAKRIVARVVVVAATSVARVAMTVVPPQLRARLPPSLLTHKIAEPGVVSC